MNVLLIFADQMRGQDMACAGNAQVLTPNIDRMAEDGTLFTRACANSPVCTPSRGSLLTGLYPLRHGAIVNDIPIWTELESLGTVFKRAGYTTGYIGKWHLDGCPRSKFTPPGVRRLGFDYWAVHNCNHDYWNAFYYTDTPKRIPIEGYESEHQTELALSFIERNRNKPFCLVLSWGPPHAPYETAPERFRRLYSPEEIVLKPNVPDECAAEAKEVLASYYAHISALDELLGKLLDGLDALGLSEDTLVVFTSDHGDMLYSLGRRKKQQPWEESISIPLIFRMPGVIPAGRKHDALVGIVDVMPTILNLAGTESSAEMDGTDFSSLFTGAEKVQDDVLIMDICPCDQGYHMGIREWRGLRTERYTYARTLLGPWILYDNLNDPYQLNNLVGEPAYKSVREELDLRLDDKLREIDDPFKPWEEIIRDMGFVELWNIRQRELHGEKGRLLE